MSSFKFPPPPPPPPKAPSNETQQSYPSQREGHSRGRGDGGRGRGGNRGGGGNNARGSGRGRGGGGPRGGQHNQPQRASSNTSSGQWQQSAPPAPPSYMNVPALGNTPLNVYPNSSFATPPNLDPNAFAQAMSFMATPEGAQSMAAFASHMASTGGTGAVPLSQSQHTPQNYPASQAGHKRKREDPRGNTNGQHTPHRKPQSQGSKPPRAKAAVPPPVPTFGFALPTPSPAATSSKAKDNKKGKVRLGLTRQDIPDESSEEEEEDVDEEAALGARLKGGGFAFEHKGEQISIQTAGDVAEWIKDRKRNFPTYQKAVEKAQAASAKRKHELEFVRKLKGKPVQPDIAPVERHKPKPHEKSQKDEKKQEELAALRKKLHESMVKKTTNTVDLGIGYGSASESDAEESSVLSDSSVVSSSEESSDDSDAESDDSDAPPEAASSKVAPRPINVPQPPRSPVQVERKPPKEKMCKNWKQFGKCQFGDSCRFKHPYREEKRVGLYEKLVEQELVKADQLALDAIKYLGQNGFLG